MAQIFLMFSGQIFPELAPLGLRYLFWWLGKGWLID